MCARRKAALAAHHDLWVRTPSRWATLARAWWNGARIMTDRFGLCART